MYHTGNGIRGFAPNPTSFFFLIKRTKHTSIGSVTEKSSQNDRPRTLLQGRNFRQSGQASLPKFQALQHSQPRLLRVLAGPTHGALNLRHYNACGAKKQIPYSDGLPFKRRRQPECVQTVSLLWLLSVTTESDRKNIGKQFSNSRIVLCA